MFGRRLAEVAQHPCQAAVASEYGDTDGIPGAQVGRGGQCGIGGGLQGFEVVVHCWVPYTERAALFRRPLFPWSRFRRKPALRWKYRIYAPKGAASLATLHCDQILGQGSLNLLNDRRERG